MLPSPALQLDQSGHLRPSPAAQETSQRPTGTP